MLLEKITLENFRQFRSESVEFASGSNGKNVTIIIGDNGSGKTTFAQAFFWCLYGETEFSDKVILNRIVADSLVPGETARVRVKLELQHGTAQYTLVRDQNYKRDASGKIKGDNTTFSIAKRDESGNTTYIKASQCESEVKSILPKELSRYFFFDGERIEKMSKDISAGDRAQDFADAVKGLLGLNAMSSAIQHFNPRRSASTSVIKSYEASFDSRSDSKVAEYTRDIEEYERKIAAADKRIEELEKAITAARARKEQKTEEIKQYADGEKLQGEKERILSKIDTLKTQRAVTIKNICSSFNYGRSSFLSVFMMLKALKIISQSDLSGKDIPHMHQDTIEYLLKQKVCICGTHLDEGTIPYQKVVELIDYLPPKSISTTVSEFRSEASRRANTEGLMETIRTNMIMLSQQEEEMKGYTDDLHSVEARLSGDDVRGKVRAINAEIQLCDATIRDSSREQSTLRETRGGDQRDMERCINERRNLTLLDANNRKVEIYKAYAEQIYMELLATYNACEADIRKQLQQTINEIFKQIYAGGLALTIDDKYRISVYATDYDGSVETSTAQSISVIFAFITGIIKMARDNRNATDRDAQLLTSEPYPLVMDAPLSAFDKRRIKSVCEALPETAEQVIIFIKDTDGELAEEHMGAKIGSRHSFEKINEFETRLI